MRFIALPCFCLLVLSLKAQTTDSQYYQLQEVEIKSYSMTSALRMLSSETILDQGTLKKYPSWSILPAMNSVAGVRMEERSPGSYRLSIRGSLLRSPFGVRNVKIYLGDFIFTDAGGNSYLQSLDLSDINSIRIMKGPEASIFGANTGGVLLIDPNRKTPDSLSLMASVSGGSFGLFQQNTFFQKKTLKSVFTLKQSSLGSNGYRENSAMQRNYLQASNSWFYSSRAVLKTLLLYSDMQYRTPGALTLQQFNENPRAARPASGNLPGAAEQNAGIINKTLFGGVSHDISITQKLRHLIAVSGTSTRFKNPFITNYEERDESSFAMRTYFEYDLHKSTAITTKINLGGEWQRSNADINNYGNRSGIKDTLQASDKLIAQQSLVFVRFLADFYKRLLGEISLSYNQFSYKYKNIDSASFIHQNFQPQWMPRIAFSYLFTGNLSARVSASRGYSAPTIAEVRSSNNIVNTSLQAETGTSYEAGFRLKAKNDRWMLDASYFYYSLKNAIVRRVDVNGNEYFINAGSTTQPGVEIQGEVWIISPWGEGFIKGLQLKSNYTLNRFTFGNYMVNSNNDYSGNKLTGVPGATSNSSISILLPGDFSLFTQYYYSSKLPLNDANSEFAEAYHLLQARFEWKKQVKKVQFNFFVGADNILNQVYSLGNDLNAFGGRFYNAAPTRNYYAGVKVEF